MEKPDPNFMPHIDILPGIQVLRRIGAIAGDLILNRHCLLSSYETPNRGASVMLDELMNGPNQMGYLEGVDIDAILLAEEGTLEEIHIWAERNGVEFSAEQLLWRHFHGSET